MEELRPAEETHRQDDLRDRPSNLYLPVPDMAPYHGGLHRLQEPTDLRWVLNRPAATQPDPQVAFPLAQVKVCVADGVCPERQC